MGKPVIGHCGRDRHYFPFGIGVDATVPRLDMRDIFGEVPPALAAARRPASSPTYQSLY
jgi:hypothetical protein